MGEASSITTNPVAAEKVRRFLEQEHEPQHYAWCATALILEDGAHSEAVDLMEAMLPRVPKEDAAEAGRVVGLLRRASDERDPSVAREAFWRGPSSTRLYRINAGLELRSVSNLGKACDDMVSEVITLLEDCRELAESQ